MSELFFESVESPDKEMIGRVFLNSSSSLKGGGLSSGFQRALIPVVAGDFLSLQSMTVVKNTQSRKVIIYLSIDGTDFFSFFLPVSCEMGGF